MVDKNISIDVKTRYKDPYSIREKLVNNTTSVEWYLLGLESHKLRHIGVIDKLVIEDFMRTKIDFYNFQMATALKVLNEMQGLALLADEVGLGKTIETGLILKELIVRDRIRSILICCPASLVTQWKDEMFRKFGEKFLSPEDYLFTGYSKTEKLVCSIGKLSNNISAIASREWDMIVVDEAHLLANPTSKRRKAVAAIPKRHMLLVTATPIQNKLSDLYSLIDLLYPGLLGSLDAFLRSYSKDYPKGRVIREDTAPQLRSYLNRVMCRTRRDESGIPFVNRHVKTYPIKGYEIEYELIDEVTTHMAKIYGGEQDGQRKYLLIREVMSLQQSLSSSPRALISTLEKRSIKHQNEKMELAQIIELAKSIKVPSKSELLLQILDGIPNDQAVIFTLRKETAYHLETILKEKDKKVALYLGIGNYNSSRQKRDDIIREFQAGIIQYIVATDAAAEGLNIQNCNIIVNYDLHWNPMKIEQRIGRIHRFGQEREVTVFNLALEDTIDEYVMNILFKKLALIQEAIGDLEVVLGESKYGDENLEDLIMQIILRSKNKVDIKKQLEELAKDTEIAAEKQKLATQFTVGVLG